VRGVRLADGEVVEAAAVVVNADASAIGTGRFGSAVAKAVDPVPWARRSFSAVTWAMEAETSGFPLVRHNVFFSKDYAAEFGDLSVRARLPAAPTVYVCAQDRGDDDIPPGRPERLLCLINAPARGDSRPPDEAESAAAAAASFGLLQRAGLRIRRDPAREVLTTPAGFETLFPATGGALYGQAVHGWKASFSRPGSRTRVLGLYLAGGSAHPGAGVPMAALSGRLAAAAVLEDRR
jgi:1-hydroxycarotenoid 3,4-desaturase